MMACQIGTGQTTYLWHDKWYDIELKSKFPHLFSFAKNKFVTVKDARNTATDSIYDLFNIPLSAVCCPTM
jgi:hypothetical protein